VTAAAVAGALVVLALALVVGLRLTHHEAARTARGYLDGLDAPLDMVRDATDLNGWNGDVHVTEVCRCSAARQLGTGRWAWRPILHRIDRPVKSLNN